MRLHDVLYGILRHQMRAIALTKQDADLWFACEL